VEARADRLDLLGRLTAATPDWVLVKSVSSAVDGSGDIDSAAPAAAWARVSEVLAEWAGTHALGPVVACDHLPGALVVAAVERGVPAPLLQLDLLDRRLLHGGTVVDARYLARAAVVAGGFRRLTPGGEAVVRLVVYEWRPLAPSPPARTLDELRAMLREDRDGARAVQAALSRRVSRAVDEVAAGSWPRRSLILAEAGNALRGLAQPVALARRVAGARARRTCPLLRALANGRIVPGSVDDWLAEVRRAHPATP
jgi:hypothetical protein